MQNDLLVQYAVGFDVCMVETWQTNAEYNVLCTVQFLTCLLFGFNRYSHVILFIVYLLFVGRKKVDGKL